MKKLHIIPVLLLFAFAVSAQSSAKKYILLEHFTNSKCSVCASKNPAFYTLINQPQYAADIHHVAIHPPYPYNVCEFYLANTAENSAWAAFYNILGTPRVALNGNLIASSSQILRQDTLTKYLNKTSPFYLQVSETGSGNVRSAKIQAFALDQVPAGNYKLFVAVIEKTINKVTPNNEAVHHDVFRDLLTPVEGQDFTMPAAGQSVELDFNYTINAAWAADQVYVLAYVKNATTKQVLNSGTKFDPVISVGASEPSAKSIRFSPNPSTQTSVAELADDTALRTEVYAANGKRVYLNNETQQKTVTVPTASFAPGVYFVKVTGEKGIYTAKLLRN